MKLKLLGFFVSLFLIFAPLGAVRALAQAPASALDYIVVFKDNIADSKLESDDIAKSHGQPKHVFSRALKGFSGKYSNIDIEKIKADPRVKYVVEDKLVKIAQTVTCTQADVDHDGSVTILDLSKIAKYFGASVAQVAAAAPYDLDADGTVTILDLSAAAKYFGQTCVVPTPTPTPTPIPLPTPTPTPIPTPTPTPTPPVSTQVVPKGLMRVGQNVTNKGTGIGVAVIDTGIQLNHPDLVNNIVAGTSCVAGNTTGNDDSIEGHGTHVAGEIAAQDNNFGVVGIAPEAKLIAVKVLDLNGSGTWSQVICGIDWVTANAATYNIKVANMSLAGPGTSDNNCGLTNNDPVHTAICNSKAAGVTYVAAAGNSGVDASASIPAAYTDSVITVSALIDTDGQPGGLSYISPYGPDDTFASFSNWGTSVKIAAPGVNILSTTTGSTYDTWLSGTSQAAPYVSGAAALYIHSHPGATLSQITNALVAGGEPNGSGHTDPLGIHPEPVLRAGSL